MSTDNDQTIEATMTGLVRFDISVKQDIDLASLAWSVSFNPDPWQTATPVTAQLDPETPTTRRAAANGKAALSTARIMVMVGPNGTPLTPGPWYPFAHTASGLETPVFPLGVLFVNGATS